MPFLTLINQSSLVMVHDLHTMAPVFFPAKTNAPLPIDPDAVLPCPIACQWLQSVAAQGR
jgi:hypothetical protein